MAKEVVATADTKEAPKGVVGGTGRTWTILSVGDLPLVPGDQEQVLAEGAQTLRRFPEASYTEGLEGLKEVAARGKTNPGELGDLVRPTEHARAAAAVLKQARDVVTRLEGLLAYHRSVLAIEEHNANIMIDTFEEEAGKRIKLARIPAEAYDNLRKFVAARGEAISRGRAQAKAVQEARVASKSEGKKPNGGDVGNG